MVSIIIVVGIVIFAMYLLYKTIKKQKAGKCSSCHVEASCSKQACTVDWNKTISEATKKG
ncbi:MAG: FeoB-associated Cys-rich membrane protein [Bacillaceae bacterium]